MNSRLGKPKDFIDRRAGWLFFFLISLLLCMTIHNKSDDFVFANAFSQYGGAAGWIVFYAQNWSGRLIPHFLLICLLQLPNFVFILINAVMLVLLVFIFNKTLLCSDINKRKWIPLFIGLLILFLLPDNICREPLFWKSAAVLYLWGIVALLFALYPLIAVGEGRTITKKDYILAFIGGLYAGSFEQAAAFLLVFAILISLFDVFVKHRYNRICLILTVFAAVVSLFFMMMPGNEVRKNAEILAWISSFGMYSVPEKILWGITYSLQTLNQYLAGAAALLSAFLYFFVFRRKSRPIRILSALISVYYCFDEVNCWCADKTMLGSTGTLLNKAFSLIVVDSADFHVGKSAILGTVLAITAFLTLVYLLFFTRENEAELVSPLFLLGGFATAALMGFSPTIYASGDRTKFIFALFFVFVLIRTVFIVHPSPVPEKE
mgnify:CR=1 FL=1